MATKRALILQAAEEFGISSEFDISPEEMQSGLTRLNRIAAGWDGKGIRVGFNLGGDLDAEAGIPDTAENCFALNLAVQWAPSFGKAISLDTKVAAKQAFSDLYVSLQRLPKAPRPSHLPVGSGNRGGVTGPQYFPDTTEVEGLNDGAAEY